MNAPINLKKLLPAWQVFRDATDIAPIRDEQHYEHMTHLLHALLDCTQSDESHPAMELVNLVGDLIEQYERKHHRLLPTSPVDALRFLMEQNGLKQSELPEIGSQGVVSEILNGKRALNLRQIRALAQRFNVAPDTFL